MPLDFDPNDFIRESEPMQEVWNSIITYAGSEANVLITGDTGTGKELAAKAIHYFSNRKAEPFVAFNCTAGPDTLFDSLLFGHRKGAFTGATSNQDGFIDAASGGTLFLDEIGNLPLSIQSKLLRFLQDKSYYRIGDTEERKADVRIVSATNKSLDTLIKDGAFMEDVYYRLKTLEIWMPPLRERVDDIPYLAAHFSKKRNMEIDIDVLILWRLIEDIETLPMSEYALKYATYEIDEYDENRLREEKEKFFDKLENKKAQFKTKGPEFFLSGEEISLTLKGDVRRIESKIEEITTRVKHDGRNKIELADFVFSFYKDINDMYGPREIGQLRSRLHDHKDYKSWRTRLSSEGEQAKTKQALDKHNGSRTHAARELGISVRTLQRRIKKYGL